MQKQVMGFFFLVSEFIMSWKGNCMPKAAVGWPPFPACAAPVVRWWGKGRIGRIVLCSLLSWPCWIWLCSRGPGGQQWLLAWRRLGYGCGCRGAAHTGLCLWESFVSAWTGIHLHIPFQSS